jgi:glycosyltransferase involved in cell wall biosynthesis
MGKVLTLVIVNYNQGNYFEDCIRSVKEQNLINPQLIVIDDCSTDNSVEQIESLLQQHNIEAHFIKNKVNKGICANLNLALSIAEGNYFSFIASDDWAEKDCYSNMISALNAADDKVAVVYGDCKIVDEKKNLLHQSYLKYYRNDLQIPPQGDIFKELLKGNFIPAMVTMSRTKVLKSVGGFDERLKVEDYDMWLRISRNYLFLYVKEASAYYRILQNSLIRRIGARKYEDWIDMYLKHEDAGPEALVIVKQQLMKCCEFLFYTDSEKFRHYYQAIEKFGVDTKLKILKFIESVGIRGSRFKQWSDKVQGRKQEQV